MRLLALLPSLALALTCTPVLPGQCYSDDSGPRALNISIYSKASTDATACANACALAGYPLAGLTGHLTPSPQYLCYCGAAVSLGSAPVPAAQCSLPCPTNATQSCGANYRLMVYPIACDGPIPKPLAPGPACSQAETIGLPFCNTSLPLTERVADLVARLTLEEIGPQLTARHSPAIPRLGINAFYWGVNNVHGCTNAVDGGELCTPSGKCVTIWPSGPALGASFNATLFRTMGSNTGGEIRALNNLNWGPAANPATGMDGLSSWGPTINLLRSPQWGRAQETASEDPFLNGIFAREITRGLQEGEDPRFLLVAACIKHFSIYSLEDYYTPSGQHITRENVNNVVSQFEAWDSYFPHFKAAVLPVAQGGGGAAGVMMAMNAVNGIPALASSELINILKGWAGPNSLYITTDGGNMIQWMCEMEPEGHSFCPYHDPPCTLAECVQAAVVAGSDIADGNEYQVALADAVAAGNLTLGDAQQRLFNTLLIRFRLGLFDPVADQPYLRYGEERIQSAAARSDNALAARQGLVLLQRGPLPFPRGQPGAVTAVLGFCGNSTSALVSNYVTTYCPGGGSACFPSLLASISALGEAAAFSPGCSSPTTCTPAAIAAAAALAAAPATTRIVLCLGIGQGQEAEQKDRVNITLPEQQQALFAAVSAAASAAARPLAVVLVHGGALSVAEVAAAGVGILDAFYPGPEGGGALADALFGAYNPGGKLPYTVYSANYTAAVDMADMRIAEVGRTYRYLSPTLSPGGPPIWRFGYGLSYTSFSLAYSGAPTLLLTPAAPQLQLPVQVTNTGAVAGDEVLQVYLVPLPGTLAPPLPPYLPQRSLVGFERVRLGPGESRLLTPSLTAFGCNLTLSDGTQRPVSGGYKVLLSRGQGVGEELEVPLTLQGWF